MLKTGLTDLNGFDSSFYLLFWKYPQAERSLLCSTVEETTLPFISFLEVIYASESPPVSLIQSQDFPNGLFQTKLNFVQQQS